MLLFVCTSLSAYGNACLAFSLWMLLPLDARFVRVASRQHPSIVLWCRETARDTKDRVRRCLDDTRHSHSRPPGLSAGMSACRIRGIVKMRGTAAELGRHISASPAKTALDGIWRRFEGIKSPRNPPTVASGGLASAFLPAARRNVTDERTRTCSRRCRSALCSWTAIEAVLLGNDDAWECYTGADDGTDDQEERNHGVLSELRTPADRCIFTRAHSPRADGCVGRKLNWNGFASFIERISGREAEGQVMYNTRPAYDTEKTPRLSFK